MQYFRPRPGVSHHSYGDGAIVLDVDRDRYWRVGQGAAFMLDWMGGKRAGAVHPEAIEQLCGMGLAEKSAAHSVPPRSSLPAVRTSAIEHADRDERLRFADFAEVAAWLVAARFMVRRTRLGALLDGVRQARKTSTRQPAGDLDAIARRFHASRSLVPLSAKCLPDTLAFLQFAARRGHFPRFVFGVLPVPFAAHCWAQDGDRVLNDAVGHTRAFMVLLTV